MASSGPAHEPAPPMRTGDSIDAVADRAGVELIAWPGDEQRRQLLARAGVPRLLLVAPGAEAPTALGVDEDWVRLPCDVGDVSARLGRLSHAIDRLRHDRPRIDRHHVVHHGGSAILLSPAQAALVDVLLARPGTVVAREVLEATVWPDGAPGPKALDGVVFRLRRRLAGLGLVVRSSHGRGFAIDVHVGASTAALQVDGAAPDAHEPGVGRQTAV